jgi:hypothetical protein
MFLHCRRLIPTPWPSAGCVWPPPDACQPCGRVVACDVVGPQGGWNTVLSCWYVQCLIRENGVLTLRIGTSDHSLPPVKMDCVYAGSRVGFHPPVSPLVQPTLRTVHLGKQHTTLRDKSLLGQVLDLNVSLDIFIISIRIFLLLKLVRA